MVEALAAVWQPMLSFNGQNDPLSGDWEYARPFQNAVPSSAEDSFKFMMRSKGMAGDRGQGK